MTRWMLFALLLAALSAPGCDNRPPVTPGQPTPEQQAEEEEYTRQTEEAMKRQAEERRGSR